MNDFLPTDAQILQAAALALPIMAIVMLYGWRHEIMGLARRLVDRYLTVHYVNEATGASDAGAVSARQDAVKENAESGKPAGPTPAELDRMLADARHEAVARAIGTLAGRGILPPGQRSAALLAVGIEGRRYQRWKPAVDAAQAAAQAELPAAPAEPPRLTPLAGRPVPLGVQFLDDLEAEPANP